MVALYSYCRTVLADGVKDQVFQVYAIELKGSRYVATVSNIGRRSSSNSLPAGGGYSSRIYSVYTFVLYS